MTTQRDCSDRLTPHQRRVLAALLALEESHHWTWWTRDAIGYVVGAGGFHGTIQIKTISILKRAGLVQTERSSWNQATRDKVGCNCAYWHWGLTAAGLKAAASAPVRWPEDALERVRRSDCYGNFEPRDEDEGPRGPNWDGHDDDDGDGDPSPVPRPSDLLHP
jgi:hypothetical protein